eukprot:TRINITY_DN1817_c0_g1_i2.p1 TRINITY_DN1817_c0_g1~~TRINITY_DN1817_c0_g1_i2.p1  ORF type:complete len:199 (+),score=45.43 TRINITY_DN1817_c0_g1_i2:266-862(+)
MKINSNTRIIGEKIELVPYKPEHVKHYHGWMTDPKLLELTASEPLSLEEEYENQQSWYSDPKKLTFIVLDKNFSDEVNNDKGGAMAGDVNLFWNDYGNENAAELEIMIAEERSRGKGKGKQAVLMMMRYASTHLSVVQFFVKIDKENIISQNLFKSLGFQQEGGINYFGEVKLVYDVKDLQHLVASVPVYEETLYVSV